MVAIITKEIMPESWGWQKRQIRQNANYAQCQGGRCWLRQLPDDLYIFHIYIYIIMIYLSCISWLWTQTVNKLNQLKQRNKRYPCSVRGKDVTKRRSLIYLMIYSEITIACYNRDDWKPHKESTNNNWFDFHLSNGKLNTSFFTNIAVF